MEQKKRKQIRNRRLMWVENDLLKTETPYFGMESMRERFPLLYHQYVGRFHTTEPFNRDMRLSERLLKNFEMDEHSQRQRYVMAQQEVAVASQKLDKARSQMDVEEYDSDDEDRPATASVSESEAKLREAQTVLDQLEDDEGEELTEEELMLAFVRMAKESFLDGRDGEFVDYASIDQDERLDNLAQITLDAQEEYFDDMEYDLTAENHDTGIDDYGDFS